MPRKISSVLVPVDLAIEIDRLLHFAEELPIVGDDARRARRDLRAIEPNVFTTLGGGPPCDVCGASIPLGRVLNAAMRGQRALYDTDQCRETARKRRYRAS